MNSTHCYCECGHEWIVLGLKIGDKVTCEKCGRIIVTKMSQNQEECDSSLCKGGKVWVRETKLTNGGFKYDTIDCPTCKGTGIKPHWDFWVNIEINYKNQTLWFVYPTRESADKNSSFRRIACVRVDWKSGDGLTVKPNLDESPSNSGVESRHAQKADTMQDAETGCVTSDAISKGSLGEGPAMNDGRRINQSESSASPVASVSEKGGDAKMPLPIESHPLGDGMTGASSTLAPASEPEMMTGDEVEREAVKGEEKGLSSVYFGAIPEGWHSFLPNVIGLQAVADHAVKEYTSGIPKPMQNCFKELRLAKEEIARMSHVVTAQNIEIKKWKEEYLSAINESKLIAANEEITRLKDFIRSFVNSGSFYPEHHKPYTQESHGTIV